MPCLSTILHFSKLELFWARSIFLLETALGWKKPQAGSSLGLEVPDLEGPVLEWKCTFEISWSQ